MTYKYELQVPSIVDTLRESGETFELLSIQDTTANTEWIKNNFPIASWGRMNWLLIPESVCIRHTDDSELVTAFEKIVEEREKEL